MLVEGNVGSLSADNSPNVEVQESAGTNVNTDLRVDDFFYSAAGSPKNQFLSTALNKTNEELSNTGPEFYVKGRMRNLYNKNRGAFLLNVIAKEGKTLAGKDLESIISTLAPELTPEETNSIGKLIINSAKKMVKNQNASEAEVRAYIDALIKGKGRMVDTKTNNTLGDKLVATETDFSNIRIDIEQEIQDSIDKQIIEEVESALGGGTKKTTPVKSTPATPATPSKPATTPSKPATTPTTTAPVNVDTLNSTDLFKLANELGVDYDKTKAGRPKTDKGSIEKLKNKIKEVQESKPKVKSEKELSPKVKKAREDLDISAAVISAMSTSNPKESLLKLVKPDKISGAISDLKRIVKEDVVSKNVDGSKFVIEAAIEILEQKDTRKSDDKETTPPRKRIEDLSAEDIGFTANILAFEEDIKETQQEEIENNLDDEGEPIESPQKIDDDKKKTIKEEVKEGIDNVLKGISNLEPPSGASIMQIPDNLTDKEADNFIKRIVLSLEEKLGYILIKLSKR